MSFSDIAAGIDASTQEHLCDPFEIRPVAGGDALVVMAMVDEPVVPPGLGMNAPMLQAEIQVATADHRLRVGDVAVEGRMVAGVFVATIPARAWRVAGAPMKDASGRWQKAAVERFSVT